MQKFTEAQVTGKSTELSRGPPPVQQMIRMYGTWDMAPLILSASSAAFSTQLGAVKLRRLVLKTRWRTLHYLHTQLVFLIVQIYVCILRQNGLWQKDHEDCKTITCLGRQSQTHGFKSRTGGLRGSAGHFKAPLWVEDLWNSLTLTSRTFQTLSEQIRVPPDRRHLNHCKLFKS